ncbi:hypothetical protein [Terrabacter sp. BE26]|uniref:hypothetical protein n=1 Tax=Terrabacter sp. BE26 TaxID=2898152 RepID=UPI0035BE8918
MTPKTRPVRPGRARPARPVRAARSLTLLTLAVGAVLATSACGQASPSSGSATPAAGGGPQPSTGSAARTTVVGSVRLEASLAPEGQVQTGATGAGMSVHPGLVVDYRVTNTGTQPVLAYDVVPQELGSGTLPVDVDLQHAWVYEESGALRISKQGFATAPNVRFIAAPVMGGHVIAPGASLTGRAYAVWPPVLDVPGDSFSAPRQPVDPAVGKWQFCVQVDGRTGQAKPSSVGDGVVQVPVTAPQGDELVCTQPAALPIR